MPDRSFNSNIGLIDACQCLEGRGNKSDIPQLLRRDKMCKHMIT